MFRTPLLALLTCLVLGSLPAAGHGQENRPSPDEALQRLKAGNARFVADMLQEAVPPSRQRLATAKKQKPIAVILTCADSRAAPEYIFDKGIGVLFVIRVAGNVGGPEVYASMEYAVAVLEAPLVVVLGHTRCGAVDAVLKGKDLPTTNLKRLIEQIRPGENPKNLDAAIRHNILAQTKLVAQGSSLLQEFASSGRIRIVPALYDLKTGAVSWLDATTKK